MKLERRTPRADGIALLMVLLVILVLAILAGGFAWSMRVETILARNAADQEDLEWVGRSGLEYARYVLGQSLLVPNEPYDALNQFWAGGPMGTNEVLAGLSLQDVPLGERGRFSVEIQDMERRYNINVADEAPLRLALDLMEVDLSLSGIISDSVLDWIDQDDQPRLNGAESDYYLTLNPPFAAKNGPVDDLTELMRVQGVSPEIFWGPRMPPGLRRLQPSDDMDVFVPAIGLADLFTPLSARLINLNTASAQVLQLIPGIDQASADAILQFRAGPDGLEGNEDDTPFRTVQELVNVPTGILAGGGANALGAVFTVRSATFKVRVTGTSGDRTSHWIGIVRRESPSESRILAFYRE